MSTRQQVLAILANFANVASEHEHEHEQSVFRVAWAGVWPDPHETRDVVSEIQALLPAGWICTWTGDTSTDAVGNSTSFFVVERIT